MRIAFLILMFLISGNSFAEVPSYCQTNAGKSQTFMAMGFINATEDDAAFLKVRQMLFDQCKDLETKKTESKALTLALHTSCKKLSRDNFNSKESKNKYASACDAAYNAADSYFEGLEHGKANCAGTWTKPKGTKIEIDLDVPPNQAPKATPPK